MSAPTPDPAGSLTQRLDLRPPAHGVERRAIGLWMLQGTVIAVPALAAVIIAFILWESARPWLAVALVAAGLLLIAVVIIEPLWRYRVHRWETTEEAIYARSGWLVKEWRAAPLSRVQTVDSVQGPFEQLLGLSTLTVTTASSSGAIDIVGLDRETASRVAEELTRIAQLTPGDAT